MKEIYEITSVSLVMRPIGGSNTQGALAALMSSTTYLEYTRNASTVKATIHMDGSNRPYVIVLIEYPSSFTGELIKTGSSFSEPKTSCERTLPRHAESGEDTLHKFAAGKWDE